MKFIYLGLIVALFVGCTTTSLPNQNASTVPKRTHNNIRYKTSGIPVKGTVVFESGFGNDMSPWNQVYNETSRFSRVFAYNRPGYAGSQRTFNKRSPEQIAKELEKLLRETGTPAPYILVGHSSGGLYMNAFARLYPEKTAGVVLVDASHPSQFDIFEQKGSTAIKMMSNSISLMTTEPQRSELLELKRGAKAFNQLPRFPEVPLIVLTGAKLNPMESKKDKVLWMNMQRELAAMSSLSSHRMVDSTHFIQRKKPEVVVEAIYEMVENVF